ncbi:MAG: GAK system XXXCH domain-containing protein [Desulfobacca sp.]|uniref:GAK system XXXCH domain-containing protein n=1 Tax=Desulfobacca sp. TaxID=2067990 RepID=UPI00404B1433
MEARWEREFPREELADYLTSLAEQIRRGELQVAGLTQKLPPLAAAEILVKEKKGRLVAKLRLSFATLASYGAAQQEALTAQVESFQVIKKRLAASWTALTKAAAGGGLPSEAVLADFLQDSDAFAQQADPEWQTEMDLYLAHVHNLEQAHRLGQADMFQHELADIQTSLSRCHREFK